MNISNINRLNNEYRALRNQAEAVYMENGMVHSNEEGLCYQKAANIAGQLASMNIGAESNHWVEEQQKCQQQIKDRQTVMDDVSIEDLTGFLCRAHRKEHDGGFPQCCIPAVAQGPEEKDQNRGIKDDEQAHPGAKGCHADSE